MIASRGPWPASPPARGPGTSRRSFLRHVGLTGGAGP
ncbi:twin-arginine translocation signal domain-containing protein, partial [Streptomyces sp. NPDC007095]